MTLTPRSPQSKAGRAGWEQHHRPEPSFDFQEEGWPQDEGHLSAREHC